MHLQQKLISEGKQTILKLDNTSDVWPPITLYVDGLKLNFQHDHSGIYKHLQNWFLQVKKLIAAPQGLKVNMLNAGFTLFGRTFRFIHFFCSKSIGL